jgi:hypothetical protein
MPPLIYGFPRHRSTMSLLVALIGDKKPRFFAWCMNTEFIVKLLINRGWLNILKSKRSIVGFGGKVLMDKKCLHFV